MNPELQMKTMGRVRAITARLKAAENKRATSIPGAHRDVVRLAIPKMVEELERTVYVGKRTARRGRGKKAPGSPAGPQHSAHPLLRMVKPAAAAMIACRTTLDTIGDGTPLTQLLVKIGARVEDEARMRAFRKEAPGLYRKVLERVQDSADYRYQHRVMVHAHNMADDVTPWQEWTTAQRLRVGARLVECLIETTGLVEKVQLRTKRGMTTFLRLTPTASTAIAAATDRYDALAPWFLPLTIRPRPWKNFFEGGYWTHDMVLVGGWMPIMSSTLEHSNIDVILSGVNAMQDTAWAVNQPVLATALELMRAQAGDVPGLPTSDPVVVPARPTHIPVNVPARELPEEQRAELQVWKRQKAEAISAEQRRQSQALASRKVIEVARMFEDAPAIYFPHTLDWRGRAYPRPLFLSPQGRDLSRGLLRFAAGKPVGDEGGEWLAIHGANLWGEDKVPFVQRVTWVLDHEAEIAAVADDPVSNRWWCEADQPWQFLAWCLEWAEFAASGHSASFVSYIPVSMDGSCNGLQHFSAMLRDEVGGRAVNLTPCSEPQDIYTEVAQALTKRLEQHRDDKVCREWLASGLIDRKLVKRQVMTLPYGATKRGMCDQLMELLNGWSDTKLLPFEELPLAARTLTEHLWETIGTVVHAARAAMDWLQEVASICVKAGVPLTWETPHGFVVEQAYPALRKYQIKTQLCGTIQLRVNEADRTRLDWRRQRWGAAPNFVHSLDAAHMFLTIDALPDLSWANVHDSYGTHAADADALARVLRLTFVEMYSRNQPLNDLRARLQPLLDEELPPVPEAGNLKLDEVLDSLFFFA